MADRSSMPHSRYCQMSSVTSYESSSVYAAVRRHTHTPLQLGYFPDSSSWVKQVEKSFRVEYIPWRALEAISTAMGHTSFINYAGIKCADRFIQCAATTSTLFFLFPKSPSRSNWCAT